MKKIIFNLNKNNSTTTKVVILGCVILTSLLIISVSNIVKATDPTLNVSCSASPITTTTGQTVTFISSVSGGNGTYNRTWSGACTGSGANCSRSFSSPGTYTANLTVTSGTQSRSASCPVQITAVACNTDSQCGTSGYIGSPFCQNNNVYQNYKTYTCIHPGTPLSACSNSVSPRLKETCNTGETCSNGSCMPVTCSTNSQCGTDGFIGDLFCQNNNVYQNYKTYTCNNPGTSYSSCSNSITAQLKTTCTGSQVCSNGSCANSCTQNFERKCSGNNLYWYDSCGNQGNFIEYCANGCSNGSCIINYCTYNSYQRCDGNNLYWYDSCGNRGNLIQYCPNGCSGNSCIINNCILNYQQRCDGNNLYWYDSCGNRGNLIQYCANGCYGNSCQNYTTGNLAVTKTVRNLTNGSGFSSSIYANPSDVLMFMITIQVSGTQDIQNVFLRDTLPTNLNYKNELVVARSNTTNSNYSGDIISGINLNTIPINQTVTITYQVQVAPIQNFGYGTTTLNNNVYVTGSNGNNQSSRASVYVTRSGVLGASSISTGLTNNFWVDSFLLPLLLTLIIIWMWRSGMFFGIEKWLDNKRKIKKEFKAEKELLTRISQIKKIDNK